jgi:hypothetical protein
LTNSIENSITGDAFHTDVLLVESKDLKKITKKNGWLFNGSAEYKLPDRDAYKLIIMGLIKEPLDVDFYVDPRPLTKNEQKMISDYIIADKRKRKHLEVSKKRKIIV